MDPGLVLLAISLAVATVAAVLVFLYVRHRLRCTDINTITVADFGHVFEPGEIVRVTGPTGALENRVVIQHNPEQHTLTLALGQRSFQIVREGEALKVPQHKLDANGYHVVNKFDVVQGDETPLMHWPYPRKN